FVRTHGVVSPRGVSEPIDARLSRDHDVLAPTAPSIRNDRTLVQIPQSYVSHIAFIYGASASLPPLWARRLETPQLALQISPSRRQRIFSRCEVAHTYRSHPRSILRPLKMPIRRSLFSIAGVTASRLWSRKEIGNAQNSSYRRDLRRGCNDDDHRRLE